MLNEKIEQAFNDQINAETHSGWLYLQMAAWLDEKNLSGMSQWMEVQAQEETLHAMKFFRHIQERGGSVKLQAIDAPKKLEWGSVEELFADALAHEQYITGRINDLSDLADEVKDRACRSLLQWFTDEQVEEEDNVQTNLDNVKLAGEQGPALMMLDREMAGRVFAYPTQVTGTGEEPAAN